MRPGRAGILPRTVFFEMWLDERKLSGRTKLTVRLERDEGGSLERDRAAPAFFRHQYQKDSRALNHGQHYPILRPVAACGKFAQSFSMHGPAHFHAAVTQSLESWCRTPVAGLRGKSWAASALPRVAAGRRESHSGR